MTTWACLHPDCTETGTTDASEKRHRDQTQHATLTSAHDARRYLRGRRS
jgi:hypothetical protein